MEDYKEIAHSLITQFYSPTPIPGVEPTELTTQEVLTMLQGIIPQHPITDHDVYETLIALGYTICQVHIEHIQEGAPAYTTPVLHWQLYPLE
ncbi:MAG: hypothetical protein Q4F57_02440 [Weeksellaceae bacterium]|nr:hypothetical protein [Weeksellaceae bacterium]